jgi:hypothetical protein
MSNFLRVFVLTNREERVVIVIMLVVVGATLARHYRSDRSHVPTPTTTSTPAPAPSAEDEEAAARDESP